MRVKSRSDLSRIKVQPHQQDEINDMLKAKVSVKNTQLSLPKAENEYEERLNIILRDAYGMAVDGGEVFRELLIIPGRNYRVDFALPKYQISVELDGYKDHSSVSGFFRDYDKDMLLLNAHWHPIRVSTKQLKDPGALIEVINKTIELRPRWLYEIAHKGAYPRLESSKLCQRLSIN